MSKAKRRWQYRAMGVEATGVTEEHAYAALESCRKKTLEMLGDPPVRNIRRFFRVNQNAYGMSMEVLVDPVTAKIQ